MQYKKGQIVPRFLVKCSDRKAQHLVKFGCDVEVYGKTIEAITYGSVFELPCTLRRKMKNGTKKRVAFNFIGLYIKGFCGNALEDNSIRPTISVGG